jgi:hypothetical protein
VICYVAHSISAPWAAGRSTWARHRESVRQLAEDVAKAGIVPVVPVLFEDVPWSTAMRLDKELVLMAGVVFVHQSKWPSSGVEREVKWAKAAGIPVVTSLDELRQLRRKP